MAQPAKKLTDAQLRAWLSQYEGPGGRLRCSESTDDVSFFVGAFTGALRHFRDIQADTEMVEIQLPFIDEFESAFG
jgi:hypothetical protein